MINRLSFFLIFLTSFVSSSNVTNLIYDTSKPPNDADTVRSMGIYRPGAINIFPEEVLVHFRKVDAYLARNASRGFSTRFLDFQAKLLYKSFELGSRNYSFKSESDGRPCAALEIFLTSLATNTKIVKSLFTSFDSGTLTEIQKLILFAVIKMLLGCNEISVEKIIECLKDKHDLNLKVVHNVALLDVDFIFKYHQIVRIFHMKNLIYIAKISTIEYSDLISDNPISITANQISIMIRPASLISPRPASIKGLWIDHCASGLDNCRQRTIFKSSSEVFFIYIDRRLTQHPSFFDNSIYFTNGNEYQCVGVVSLARNENVEFLEYIAIDFFHHSKNIIRNLIPGQTSTINRINDQNAKHLADMSKYNSVLMLYAKNVSKKFERKTTHSISTNLVKEVIKDFTNDLNIQLKHDE